MRRGRIPPRHRGHVARRLVRASRIDTQTAISGERHYDVWLIGLRCARLFDLYFPERFARYKDQPTTLPVMAATARAFVDEMETTTISCYQDFNEWREWVIDSIEMDLDDDYGDEVMAAEDEFLESWTGDIGMLNAIDRWLEQTPLMVFGARDEDVYWRESTYQLPLIAVEWVCTSDKMRKVMDAIWHGRSKNLQEMKTVIFQLPSIAPCPRRAFIAELNRVPVLGEERFGDLVEYMIGDTGNVYADATHDQLDMGGGWQDSLPWEDPETILSISAAQRQAEDLGDRFAGFARRIEKRPGLIIDFLMAMYGAAAVARAFEGTTPPVPLIDILSEELSHVPSPNAQTIAALA